MCCSSILITYTTGNFMLKENEITVFDTLEATLNGLKAVTERFL